MKHFTNILSFEDLKKQYKTLALVNHPDVGGDSETMKAINNEYDALFIIWKRRDNVTDASKETAHSTRSEFYTQNGWKGENYNSNLSLKEIACLVREFAKTYYNDCKFSVTTEYFSMGQELNVAIMESPFKPYKEFDELSDDEKSDVRKWYTRDNRIDRYKVDEIDETIKENFAKLRKNSKCYEFFTDEISEPINAVSSYVKSFKYDDSDAMIDYFHVNFYFTNIDIGKCGKPYKIVERERTVTEPVEYENVTVIKKRTYKALEPQEIEAPEKFELNQYFQLKSNFNYGRRKGFVYKIDELTDCGYICMHKMGKGYKKTLTGKEDKNRLTTISERLNEWINKGTIVCVELVEVEKTEEYTTVIRRPKKAQAEQGNSQQISKDNESFTTENLKSNKSIYFEFNEENNGIELYFDKKPSQTVLDALKANRWKWHFKKKCWYNILTDSSLAIAQSISEDTKKIYA